MRPSDIVPKVLMAELLRLYRKNPDWVRWEFSKTEDPERQEYRARCVEKTWVSGVCRAGADYFSMLASSHWLGQGPKIFKPNPEQLSALERVDVNITLGEYCQPYPAVLVETPLSPYFGVLCHHHNGLLTGTVLSVGHGDDITNTVANPDTTIEQALRKFDDDCQGVHEQAARSLRVAFNACLALAHFGCHADYLYPKEVESDQRLAKEKTERGERARKRLALPVLKVSFDREVLLHKPLPPADREGQEPSGRTVATHWRRGHWAMQPCGPLGSQRKRILRPPVMVRADLFRGDPSGTVTTYRG